MVLASVYWFKLLSYILQQWRQDKTWLPNPSSKMKRDVKHWNPSLNPNQNFKKIEWRWEENRIKNRKYNTNRERIDSLVHSPPQNPELNLTEQIYQNQTNWEKEIPWTKRVWTQCCSLCSEYKQRKLSRNSNAHNFSNGCPIKVHHI